MEELGDDGEDFASEGDVLGFFGVDAEPREVGEAEFGSTFGFVVGELAEIVSETFDATSVKSGPEGGFTYGCASCGDHGLVVVRGATDHMGVGFDIAHGILAVGRWGRREGAFMRRS